MPLIFSRRNCRVILHGDPFVSLKGFSIKVATILNAGSGGEPIMNPSSQWMYDDQQPDLRLSYGDVGIEEFSEGNIWAGAGPITVDGRDGRSSYKVSFAAFVNRMLAEEEEITVLARWNVTAVV